MWEGGCEDGGEQKRDASGRATNATDATTTSPMSE